jgi:hypothetical protein
MYDDICNHRKILRDKTALVVPGKMIIATTGRSSGIRQL